MSQKTCQTITLFGAYDADGRLYLTDTRERLPANTIEIREFAVAPEKLEEVVLSVQAEELRQIPVTIHVGTYQYQTPAPLALSEEHTAHQDEPPCTEAAPPAVARSFSLPEDKSVTLHMPSFSEIFDALPLEWRTEKVYAALLAAYRQELHTMITTALHPGCAQPRVVLSMWRQAGSQWIIEFSVSDTGLPWTPAANFHGQNTSQWRYGGAIVLQNGEISTHH